MNRDQPQAEGNLHKMGKQMIRQVGVHSSTSKEITWRSIDWKKARSEVRRLQMSRCIGTKAVVKESAPWRSRVNFIRYADDFIITGKSRTILERYVLPAVKQFLSERGLQLSEGYLCGKHQTQKQTEILPSHKRVVHRDQKTSKDQSGREPLSA